jgi:hypothetical protein
MDLNLLFSFSFLSVSKFLHFSLSLVFIRRKIEESGVGEERGDKGKHKQIH